MNDSIAEVRAKLTDVVPELIWEVMEEEECDEYFDEELVHNMIVKIGLAADLPGLREMSEALTYDVIQDLYDDHHGPNSSPEAVHAVLMSRFNRNVEVMAYNAESEELVDTVCLPDPHSGRNPTDLLMTQDELTDFVSKFVGATYLGTCQFSFRANNYWESKLSKLLDKYSQQLEVGEQIDPTSVIFQGLLEAYMIPHLEQFKLQREEALDQYFADSEHGRDPKDLLMSQDELIDFISKFIGEKVFNAGKFHVRRNNYYDVRLAHLVQGYFDQLVYDKIDPKSRIFQGMLEAYMVPHYEEFKLQQKEALEQFFADCQHGRDPKDLLMSHDELLDFVSKFVGEKAFNSFKFQIRTNNYYDVRLAHLLQSYYKQLMDDKMDPKNLYFQAMLEAYLVPHYEEFKMQRKAALDEFFADAEHGRDPKDPLMTKDDLIDFILKYLGEKVFNSCKFKYRKNNYYDVRLAHLLDTYFSQMVHEKIDPKGRIFHAMLEAHMGPHYEELKLQRKQVLDEFFADSEHGRDPKDPLMSHDDLLRFISTYLGENIFGSCRFKHRTDNYYDVRLLQLLESYTKQLVHERVDPKSRLFHAMLEAYMGPHYDEFKVQRKEAVDRFFVRKACGAPRRSRIPRLVRQRRFDHD